MEGYLLTATKYNYKYDKEDRLTQVFVATFNRSKCFKKSFLRQIGFRRLTSIHSFIAVPQDAEGESRPDITIYKDEKKVVIIESKKESPLDPKQLKKHKTNNPGCIYVTLTLKHETPAPGWTGINWYNFNQAILKITEHQKLESFERFFLEEYLSFCEATKMLRANKITKEEAKAIGKFFYQIRNKGQPSLSINKIDPIRALGKFNDILDSVLDKLRYESDNSILKKLNTFKKSSYNLDSQWDVENKDELDEHKKFYPILTKKVQLANNPKYSALFITAYFQNEDFGIDVGLWNKTKENGKNVFNKYVEIEELTVDSIYKGIKQILKNV
jgi:hypothetical protein